MDAITIKDNEQYLRQVSTSVKKDDIDISKDIELLESFCNENDVMAMAAVQIGIPKRLLYLKNTDLSLIEKFQYNSETEEEKNYNERRILINPVIISKEGLTEYWEACASCLDNMGLVKRPYKLTIEYYDVNWNKHINVFEGFESTVLSHELDHLDGILHMDIADEVLVMTQEERKEFRKTHGYTIYNKVGNYDDLITKNKIK